MTKRKRQRTKPRFEGPSIADFYRAMLTGAYTPIAVPRYQDYLDWRDTLTL